MCPNRLSMRITLATHARLLLFQIFGLIFILVSLVNPLNHVNATDIEGNDHDNVLSGTMGSDKISGEGGTDKLFGTGGKDTISGGSGDDFIQGDLGNDTLNGNSGNDSVQGGAGSDIINGDDGNDLLIASFVNSSMSIRDFAPDIIACGTGNDTAFINVSDNDTASSDCETVINSP